LNPSNTYGFFLFC